MDVKSSISTFLPIYPQTPFRRTLPGRIFENPWLLTWCQRLHADVLERIRNPFKTNAADLAGYFIHAGITILLHILRILSNMMLFPSNAKCWQFVSQTRLRRRSANAI